MVLNMCVCVCETVMEQSTEVEWVAFLWTRWSSLCNVCVYLSSLENSMEKGFLSHYKTPSHHKSQAVIHVQTSGHNAAPISPSRGSVIGAKQESVRRQGAFLWSDWVSLSQTTKGQQLNISQIKYRVDLC